LIAVVFRNGLTLLGVSFVYQILVTSNKNKMFEESISRISDTMAVMTGALTVNRLLLEL
jgi:hypothetical protein